MPRRARIHKRVGEAIEAAQGRRHGRYLPELAHHFTRGAADAEDAEKAITYALRAAEQAATMLAHEEAAEHYARALDVQGRFQPEAMRRRCELLLALGEARVRSGERAHASSAFREAAALAEQLGDGAGARPRRGRGVPALRPAAGGGRRGADRDDRARARARAGPDADAGAPAGVPVRGDLLLARPRPDAGPQPGSHGHRGRARRSRGARARLRRPPARVVGRAAPGRPGGGLDRDAHAGAPDRQPRAPAPGPRLARGRPARAGRP